MRCFSYVLVAVCALEVQAYNIQSSNNQTPQTSRRNVLATAAAAGASLFLGTREAVAAEEDPLIPLYFGVGVRPQ
jgi:hypothetical protein